MFGLGPMELVLIVVVIALIFGARKLPELGKGLGRGIKEFRQEMRDEQGNPVTDVPSKQLDPVTSQPMNREKTVENPNERRS